MVCLAPRDNVAISPYKSKRVLRRVDRKRISLNHGNSRTVRDTEFSDGFT